MVATTWQQVDRELGISIRSARRFMGGGSTSRSNNQSRTLNQNPKTTQVKDLIKSTGSLSVNGSKRALGAARDFSDVVQKKPRFVSHFALITAVVAVVAVSGINSARTHTAANAQAADKPKPISGITNDQGYGGLVDQTASAYIAAGVAKEADLPVSSDINSKVQDLTSQAAVATNNDGYLNKPAVVSTDSRRDIQTYTVQAGDTLDSISQKFNITANTVRWANNLRGNADPAPGTQLTILPVNGVLHTVSATDTPDGLATLYKANAQQIVSFNDAEIDGLKPGSRIIIPDGVVQEAAVVGAATGFSNTVSGGGAAFTPSYGGNGYDFGWCTWYAANRRAAAGKPIPSNWGNAISWRYNAAASGYAVSGAPQPGAVASQNGIGGWGHVAYVEEVNGGMVRVSEMNYGAGWGRMSTRWEPASAFTYIY